MICPDCEATLEQPPCACGWTLKTDSKDKQGKACLLKPCAHPGCLVMIRWAVGQLQGDPLCKWHQAGTAYARGPEVRKDDSKPMTRAEFGEDLYNAIRLNAGRLQCLKQGNEKKAKELQKQVQALLPHIPDPDDVRRILAMRNEP